MTTLTIGIGLITTGERQIIIQPTDKGLPPRRGLLSLHGAGSGADGATNYGNQAVTTNALSRAGVTTVSADWGGPQTWGNDSAMLALDQGWQWLQSQPNVLPGKVALHGGSMGGLNALVWAARNPEKVACLSLEIPVVDLDGVWRENISGFRSLINNAYGGLWNVDSANSTDPLTMARNGKFNNVPILINYGDSDAICLPNKTREFLTYVPSAIGFELIGGHSESTQLKVSRDYQTQFLLNHL